MRYFYTRFPLFLLAFIISCSKPGSNAAGNTSGSSTQTDSLPTYIENKNDSLFSWKHVYFSMESIVDVWFTSASKGVMINGASIYQSTDSGRSWLKLPGTFSSSPLSFFFVDTQYGFEQNETQIQLTKDGGNTWSLKSLPTSKVLNVFFESPSTGYYCDLDSGVYRTVDTCNTWSRVFQLDGDTTGFYSFFLNASTGFIFTGAGNLYKTQDGAASWQQIGKNIVTNNTSNPNWNALLFTTNLTGYYANDNGLLKTIDGGASWQVSNSNGATVNIIKFPTSDTGYYSSGKVIYKTVDAGKTWSTSCKLSADSFIGMNFVNATTGYACTTNGNIYRLTP
jgi:photosystem II stability/assembly factor-like uncharacterized protein